MSSPRAAVLLAALAGCAAPAAPRVVATTSTHPQAPAVEPPREVVRLAGTGRGTGQSVALMPDGRGAAILYSSGPFAAGRTMTVWSFGPQVGAVDQASQVGWGSIEDMRFSPDSSKIGARTEHALLVYRMDEEAWLSHGLPSQGFRLTQASKGDLAFDATGQFVVATGDREALLIDMAGRIGHVEMSGVVPHLAGFDDERGEVLAYDSATLASANIASFEAKSRTLFRRVWRLWPTADRTHLWVLSHDCGLALLERKSLRLVRSLAPPNPKHATSGDSEGCDAMIAADGSAVAIRKSDVEVDWWDLTARGEAPFAIRMEGSVEPSDREPDPPDTPRARPVFRLTDDGRKLAWLRDGAVHIVDRVGSETVLTDNLATSFTFAARGSLIATSGTLHIALWDSVSGNSIRRVEGTGGGAFAVSEDGELLAVADGDFRLLRVHDGAELTLRRVPRRRGSSAPGADLGGVRTEMVMVDGEGAWAGDTMLAREDLRGFGGRKLASLPPPDPQVARRFFAGLSHAAAGKATGPQ